jgi:diguanylate cyclase (GGDEF)-like protein
MTDAFQACVSLEDSGKFIGKYCKLFFPSTSGVVYLANNSSEKITSYAYWGSELHKPHSFPIKMFESTQIKDEYICIPLFDQNGALGLLYIHDEQILSQSENKRIKKTLIAETFAKQLSLCLTSLKLRDLLREQAIHDPLTGLFNRRYLEESLQRELHRAQRQSHSIALIMLDIDHFKMVNDTYGHEAGDEVLKNIAALLQEYSRKSDIACRFGGEEFILILPETTLEVAIQRAETLRQAVMTRDVSVGKVEIKNLSISLGVASFPQHAQSIKEIMAEADQALYKAKATGRNRVMVAEKIKKVKIT